MSRRRWLQSGALASLALPFSSWTSSSPQVGQAWDYGDPNMIRLHANENPYGPSEKAKLAIVEALSLGNRYQHDLRDRLKKAIADREGLKPENVLIGAGSMEILRHVGTHFGMKKGRVLSADMTYRTLPRYVEHLGGVWQKVPLDSEHRYDLEGMEKALSEAVDLIYVVNPNNPTGTTLATDQLKAFCKQNASQHHMMIDEAYIEYLPGGTQHTMAGLVRDYPQLMVSRTFSKFYGLAGMRVGYLLGHQDLIATMREHSTYELSVSASSMAAALATLEDTAFHELTKAKNDEGNAKFSARLREWGIPYAPSHTSFVLFQIDEFIKGGADLGQSFEDAGIVCRPFPRNAPQWCRMTIGREAEMKQVVKVLEGLRLS